MSYFGLLAILCLAPLIISIVVGAQLGNLKAAVEQLKRRVLELEGRSAARPAETSPPRRAIPPPLPDFLKPPPMSAAASPQQSPSIARESSPAFDWESVVGVKLFAWIGGLAFFLGVVFFVKYAFENNWITPEMRILAGAVVGIALVIIGSLTPARRYRIPAQSLCATGVLILYADIYAAHSVYNLIPLTAATVFMWIVTGLALFLASHHAAQSVAWLGVIGGFLTPALLWTKSDNSMPLFLYIGVLNCGIAAVSALKRWNHLIFLAAVGSVFIEFAWTADFFGPAQAETARIIFLGMEALFLAICLVLHRSGRYDYWSTLATAIAGLAALFFCSLIIFFDIFGQRRYDASLILPVLFFANAGLVALGAFEKSAERKVSVLTFVLLAALALTCQAETIWHDRVLAIGDPFIALAWYVAILLVFTAAPYVCGTKRTWPWVVAAIAGPIQFWFVYQVVLQRIGETWIGLLPLAFAIPAAIGVVYLVKRQNVALASADSRLAVQGASVVLFISLIFPVQFDREWITIGWALEGVGLLLLFRWIPNARLRAVALIVFSAAFVRLALNPAVFEYHPRSRVHIFNWYLYAYGIPALCCFAGARLFGEPREKGYERRAPAFLYTLGAILFFFLLNIEIADYYSIGPTLTFSFHGNFARDMTYTIAWAVFALVLLVAGVIKSLRPLRLAALALLSLALVKLFLHDLDRLNQLYRIGALLSVAVIAILASFIYQRVLSPAKRESADSSS
jgi:uncharacterized membrane protein